MRPFSAGLPFTWDTVGALSGVDGRGGESSPGESGSVQSGTGHGQTMLGEDGCGWAATLSCSVAQAGGSSSRRGAAPQGLFAASCRRLAGVSQALAGWWQAACSTGRAAAGNRPGGALAAVKAIAFSRHRAGV